MCNIVLRDWTKLNEATAVEMRNLNGTLAYSLLTKRTFKTGTEVESHVRTAVEAGADRLRSRRRRKQQLYPPKQRSA